MTFLHAGVLAGLAAIAIPILLHLLMRQKPKRIAFPALRLLQDNVKRSTKRLRLRHLILLLARILFLAAIVLAVARPTLPAANWGLSALGWTLLFLIVAGAIAVERVLRRRIADAATSSVVQSRSTNRMRAGVAAAALIAALLTVGWPYGRQVAASMKSTRTAEALDLPVAAIFLFDVSSSMGYQRDGETRIEAARRLVVDHVNRLPGGSRVAIMSNGRASKKQSRRETIFQRSLSAVPNLIEQLAPIAATVSLNEAVRDAAAIHEADRDRVSGGTDTPSYIRRLYVVTDLQVSAWEFPDNTGLAAVLDNQSSLGVFVLDVGVDAPDNRSLTPVDVSQVQVVDGGQVPIRSRVEVAGSPAGNASAELLFETSGSNDATSVGRVEVAASTDVLFSPKVQLPAAEESLVQFQQAEIVLRGSDPLAFDDRQPFTLRVSKLPRLLICSPTDGEVLRLVEALGGTGSDLAPYRTEVIRPTTLTNQRLREIDIVVLVNVPRLEDSQWVALETFVKAGGGLAVALGSTQIESFAYNRGAAQRVLPAKLDVYDSRGRFEPDALLFNDDGGPLRDRLASYNELHQLLETTEVRKFWKVQPDDSATVVARLVEEGAPMLVERRLDAGLVLMLATAIDYQPRTGRWNNLPTLPGMNWVYIAFLDRVMRHLSRSRDERSNFTVGEAVTVTLPSQLPETATLKLQTPDLLSKPIDWSADEPELRLPDLLAPGNYQITSSSKPVAAFSLRHRADESNLQRSDESDLATVFGDGRFELARDLEELNEEIDLAEFGQEGFGFLLLLACGLFLGEMWLGSRFYQD